MKSQRSYMLLSKRNFISRKFILEKKNSRSTVVGVMRNTVQIMSSLVDQCETWLKNCRCHHSATTPAAVASFVVLHETSAFSLLLQVCASTQFEKTLIPEHVTKHTKHYQSQNKTFFVTFALFTHSRQLLYH